MTNQAERSYEFSPYRIDADKRLLLREGEVVPLTPKCFDLLLALVEGRGDVIEKDDLITRLWADSFVEEGNLTYNMSMLRKALGERANDHQYIVTVPGRGYRFVAGVKESQAFSSKAPPAEMQTDFGRPLEKPLVKVENTRIARRVMCWFFNTTYRPPKAVLLSIAVLGVGLTAFLLVRTLVTEPSISERTSVVVVDFVNETDEPDLNGLSEMLITSLERSRRLAVLTRARMFDVLKQMGKENTHRIDESLGREFAARAQVTVLVIASIRKFDHLYAIDLKVLDRKKDEYLLTAKQEAIGKASIPGMIDRLSEETRIALRERVAEARRTRQRVSDVTTKREDSLGILITRLDSTDESALPIGVKIMTRVVRRYLR